MAAEERRKIDLPLIFIFALPAVLFAFTLGRFYGHYYDNKFFNMLALELWERPSFYFYLGSHYHVPSSLYSYIAYPFFFLFGPGDLAMETPAAVFHTLTVYLCYKLGHAFYGRAVGLVFALLVALSPIHLIQVYTLPDLSFAVFLNAASLYFFTTGLKNKSAWRIGLGATVYSLGCFQAIYSVLLLPFYIVYSVYFYRTSVVGERTASANLTVLLLLFLLPAYTYLYLLAKAIFFEKAGPYLTAAFPLAVFYAAVSRRLPGPPRPTVALLLPALSIGLLAYFDLAVQIDCVFNRGDLGFYIEAAAAGGYGGRPPAHFMGRDLSVFGYPLASSVLTSILDFAGKDIAKVSASSLDGIRFLVSDYFLLCFPSPVIVLAVIGIFVLAGYTLSKSTGGASPFLHAWPLVLLASVFIPFVNLGPSYFNIRRIYILPLPLLLAAIGTAGLTGRLEKTAKLKKGTLYIAVAVLLSLDQARFSIENIFIKYREDRKGSMYHKLFYGHFYGRSYKELGEFLLKDAPLKKDGAFRAALVYTIPEDTAFGRSLPLFNSIDWYTENQLMVLYDFKDKSMELYGDKIRLKAFLGGLFENNPGLETVYFADFVDDANNLSFFSKAHPDLAPYAIVDDDGSALFDGVLFRFDRGVPLT